MCRHHLTIEDITSHVNQQPVLINNPRYILMVECDMVLSASVFNKLRTHLLSPLHLLNLCQISTSTIGQFIPLR